MTTRILPIPMGTMEPTDYYTKEEVNALISDFITASVDDLTNYYLKSDTYTQTEVNTLIGAIHQFHYEIYPSLASVTDPQTNVLYLIGPDASATGDLYEEYVYNGTDFVKIGDTSIDLSGYVTTTALNTALADYTPTSSLATVATTGDYDDLQNKPTIPAAQVNSDWNASSGVAEILNKPTIPTATSQLTNDSSYITLADVPAQVNSDWNAESGVAEILNKPTIPTATSQLTNDSSFITLADIPAQVNADWDASSGAAEILNKPTIPTVNDSTITITQGGVTKGTFTLNQSNDATIDVDAGGGSDRNEWFGSQAQFNTIPDASKDASTDYWISDIYYSEIKGTPDLSKYDTVADVNSKVAEAKGMAASKAQIEFMDASQYAFL